MGTLSAVLALFGFGGVGQRKRHPKGLSDDEAEIRSTILVIDDSRMLLQTVKPLLVEHGFNVLSASSAAKGLDMLRYADGDIRIVMLDYSLPKLEGDETLNFVRKLSPNAKIIGLAAMKLDSVSKEYLNGVDKVITKPVIATQLLDAVSEVLGCGQAASSVKQS